MTEKRPQISRRRVLAGAGVGAAAVWAAPAVTTLGANAFADGSPVCSRSVFKLDLTGVADGTYAAPSTVGNMKVTSGDVNHVGGAIFPTLGPGLDLLGEDATGITDIGPAAAIPTPGIYQVSVTLRGSQRSETDTDTATVTFGSGSTGPITLASADPPQTFVFTVNTNSGDLLNIHHVSTTADNVGIILTDLEVFACS